MSWLLSFVFLFSIAVKAQTRSQTRVEGILEESLHFVIQKNRDKALKLLRTALKRKDLSKGDREKLSTAYKRVSEIFFTDRGQSLYESAKNLYVVSSPLAAKKMSEALALEGNNTLILKGLVRAELKDGQCEEAKKDAQKIAEDEEVFLKAFETGYWYCKGSPPPAEVKVVTERPESSLNSFFEGVFALWREELTVAEKLLEKTAQVNPDFPETYYWLWKTDHEKVDAGLKYRKLCEVQKTKLVKEFENFPFICQFQGEVTDLEDINE